MWEGGGIGENEWGRGCEGLVRMKHCVTLRTQFEEEREIERNGVEEGVE